MIDDLRFIISRGLWWLAWRFIPDHQYNVIRIDSLEPAYHDPSERIIHACFHELCAWYEYNFIENDYGIAALTDDESGYSDQKLADECKALYTWWKVDRPERLQREEDYLCMDFPDEELSNHSNAYWVLEELWNKQDEKMLNRLMAIRLYIWYL